MLRYLLAFMFLFSGCDTSGPQCTGNSTDVLCIRADGTEIRAHESGYGLLARMPQGVVRRLGQRIQYPCTVVETPSKDLLVLSRSCGALWRIGKTRTVLLKEGLSVNVELMILPDGRLILHQDGSSLDLSWLYCTQNGLSD